MKRCSFALFVCTVALALLTASSCLAVFPCYKPGANPTLGDGCITLPLRQGWWNNTVTWFICTDTNNIRYAQTEKLTLAPELNSALDNGARKMYVVTNFNNVGPVFSTSPIQNVYPSYSGLWEIVFVQWNPGSCPHVITNVNTESKSNPFGLPSPDSGKITLTSIPCVPPDEVDDPIVVDCPIVALGSLGSPTGSPTLSGVYRLKQIIALDSRRKTVTLPTWKIYCSEHITNRLTVAQVIIPDVQDPGLAATIKANLAPGLAHVPFDDTQRFWVVNWKQSTPERPILVVPPAQFPIVEECPSNFFWGIWPPPCPFSWQNTNFAYSPICVFTKLDRFFKPDKLPGWTDKVTIKTPEFIYLLFDKQLLKVTDGITSRINAPQIPLPMRMPIFPPDTPGAN